MLWKKCLRCLYLFLVVGYLYYIYIRINAELTKVQDVTLITQEEPINESLWNEEIAVDESKIKRSQIYFKNLNISYYFRNEKEEFKCDGTKLLIVILSRPNSYNIRMAIRNTWLKSITSTVSYRFIIGSTWNSTIRQSNEKEFDEYKDLIYTNIRDSYHNLTLKTYAILQWQQYYCPKAEYLLKTDDDTVTDVSRLQYWIDKEYENISENFSEKVIFGRVWNNVIPKRNLQSKWYVSYERWNSSYFPDYCNGPQYLLTSKSAELILKEASQHEMLLIEDVFYTGIVAESAGIKRIDKSNNFGFHDLISSKCDENGVPYLTCINEIKLSNKMEELNEIFGVATKKLLNLSCSKWSLKNLLKLI